MVNFVIFAGGYSAFIASYLFDTRNNSLTYLDQYKTAGNPSWITRHPTDLRTVYAVNENSPQGSIQSFVLGDEDSLQLVDTASSGGNGPPFCAALSTGQVAVVNYGSGTARIIPTDDGPEGNWGHFVKDSPVLKFPTHGHSVSEPHMVYEHGNELLIPDKGNDKIWRIGQVRGKPGNFSIHGEIQQPTGSGPRHIQIRDNMLYTIHETSSTLTLQKVPAYPNGTSPILSEVSITPPNPPAGATFAAAEILIPDPNDKYPIPYIYVSNRNTGVRDPRGDTIAIFENVNNTLVLRNQVYTGLDQIRGMMTGQQAGYGGEAYIVAAGAEGNAGVKVFQRTEKGANLKQVAVNTQIPTRTSFVWVS